MTMRGEAIHVASREMQHPGVKGVYCPHPRAHLYRTVLRNIEIGVAAIGSEIARPQAAER